MTYALLYPAQSTRSRQRAADAELTRRGNRCRIVSVAPGVVATAMQEQIRETPERDFPEVAKFIGLHETGGLRDPNTVARDIWSLLDRPLDNGTILDLRDA